jgi:hypothetical protein
MLSAKCLQLIYNMSYCNSLVMFSQHIQWHTTIGDELKLRHPGRVKSNVVPILLLGFFFFFFFFVLHFCI